MRSTRRFIPTLVAVALAVAFVAGTLIYRDTAEAALYDEYARAARNVGVAVTARGDTRLPPSTLDALRTDPGVDGADGRRAERLPLLDRRGRLVTDLGEPGFGINTGTVAALRPFDVTSGRLPQAGGEAALDTRTAGRIGVAVGDAVTVVDAQEQRQQVRVVGLVDVTGFQGRRASTVVVTDSELTRLTGGSGYREVVAALRPGADAKAVRDRAGAGSPALARTGEQFRKDLAKEASGQLSGLLVGIGLFALVAVLVAAFVIVNTFTIVMAQRLRETALLRCVGAGRGQVFRMVLVEAAKVGLAGSVLGTGLGVLVAFSLSRLSSLVGLPAGDVVLTPLPLLAGPLLGLLVTVGAAVAPALRAARVRPMAALRAAVPESGAFRRLTLVLAALAALGGTVLTVAGVRGTGGALQAMVLVMVGGIGNFLALLLLTPRLVGPVVRGLGWLPGRVFGVPAKMAAANASRNPGRTAATTATLLIGVALMAGGGTVAATVNRTAEQQLNIAFPVDYILTPSVPGELVPSAVAGEVRAAGFPIAAPVRQGRSGDLLVGTLDPAAGLMPVRPGTAVVPAASDVLGARAVGSRIDLVAGGRQLSVTVAEVAQSASFVGDVVLAEADFAALFPDVHDDAMVLVKAAPGRAAAQTRPELDAVLAGHPLVQVADLAEVRDERSATIDQIVAIIAALLGFALVIAVIGIGNTLSLSVLERAQETALVRALGLTRGQLRGMLLTEALLMALTGALGGVAFGVLYGWLTATAGFGAIHPLLRVPVGQLAAFVALAALAAVLAAVLPARRAARA
ncbi:ABC transporter permease [Dactylosporangium matsuzakiense]|uniref:ABC transporter n=1 Tax=Dactylosporangium matsuzakiense TaxID=53360 RepID=A0A9W6NP16_9ACTN|nr:ABC transporter permease [Dactylosporangium matsuzakiense]UWZ42710.1 FtsX-like permease family protein [Dactylosporangium matsuzakiense]GLL03806.1 ABC transporter [Dactylosporangium matsuzakiense]